ncbi:DUF2059 domain-containing protein [Sphingomonas sinipercae]|uniref:DUF2059 domain-containing protein n=1 Tax=Sphingomonas sinipercae TaxID=2714944 RepID=A0A6G7ZQH1_9SPHN|nr:DUF2059 domain-containing protein [Sphingomonas sinipercae]QIL03178.1 DUF2059 domain-containing protein [Sphingomonas sinipercae]
MQSWLLLALLSVTGAAPPAQDSGVPDDEEENYILPPLIAPPEPVKPLPPLSAEHLRLGQQLAGLIVLSEIRDEVLRTPPKPPADAEGNPRVNARIVAQRSPSWNVAPAAASVYARLYSVDELRAMIAFFKSPAGQKFLSARRQGVVNVMHVFQQMPWYTNLYYETCGDQEFCRWKPDR